jgi:hypothetical protein
MAEPDYAFFLFGDQLKRMPLCGGRVIVSRVKKCLNARAVYLPDGTPLTAAVDGLSLATFLPSKEVSITIEPLTPLSPQRATLTPRARSPRLTNSRGL